MPKSPVYELFKNLERRWKKAVTTAAGPVYVFSPYLSSRMAENVVLSAKQPEQCQVYTLFDFETFVTGASRIETLQRLSKARVQLFAVPDLHAKVIIVPNVFASLGSQNLTARGAKRLEASVTTDDPREVQRVLEFVRPWIVLGKKLRRELIDAMAARVGPLMRAERSRIREFERIDAELQAKEDIHAAEELQKAIDQQRIEKQKLEQELARTQRLNAASNRLSMLCENGKIDYEVAHRILRASFWWLYARNGPCRSPGYADRMSGPSHDWQVQIGRNIFLVSRAIRRCLNVSKRFVDDLLAGQSKSNAEWTRELRGAISESVARPDGVEYFGPYPITGSELRFGSQAIDLDDFIREFVSWTGLSSIIDHPQVR